MLSTTPPTDFDDAARAVLRRNDRGGFTVPNGRVYPFQWNWDSAFVALGFATFDLDRAWRELETLFEGQWQDGMVPHIVFRAPAEGYYPGPEAWGIQRQPLTSGISQPPVAATAARVLHDLSAGDAARIRGLFPKLFASHRWWHEIRDPDGTGLVTMVHPWESGRDNSPDWDEPLSHVVASVDVAHLRKDLGHVDATQRPTHDFYNRVMTLVEEAKALAWDGVSVARTLSFRVCDLGIQSILLRADRDLLKLAEELGFTDEASALRDWVARSETAMQRLKGADGLYRSLDLRSGQLSEAVTCAAFLPLYARTASQEDALALKEYLAATRAVASFSVASTDPRDRRFDATRYWRGPVWLMMNRMIADGLSGYGLTEEANTLRQDSGALVRRNGFWEYFDPRNGTGCGGPDFSWTAAMWLSWCGSPSAGQALTAL
ncbi:Trehalase [Bosea sp. OK403]|uniref:MGH1-like glycoside hydrolase domain-containing protein n=1 Tax=Bosea sp. OK403 TaxID=1855286 RepID=UPI0008F1B954|nr:trehalase family glycosidase [Bosea sp. OK403]SFI08652.1 Trehalase [Bosea sp. OK403]